MGFGTMMSRVTVTAFLGFIDVTCSWDYWLNDAISKEKSMRGSSYLYMSIFGNGEVTFKLDLSYG